MIWTQPNQIGIDQNKLDSTKMIWMVQNHFGAIEGQGIKLKKKNSEKKNLGQFVFHSHSKSGKL